MARMGQREELPSGAASQGPKRTSIWTAIHPRLVEIIRQRHSTIIFVNSRRIAERLAGAINELAGEQLARAHHGSLAAAQRSEIEEQLKAGRLRALVATSSLELGIDMGAVDLVIQIEAPPSVASAMQRIGRAGHHVGAASEGVIFPKYRADLVACAAVTRAMHEGLVESTRFLRNPARRAGAADCRHRRSAPPGSAPSRDRRGEVFRLVRGAAPFSSLTRAAFTGVLDLLAGRYPSDEFADLRPRITWDRVRDTLTPREGVKMLAILNGGTIPDRGLYGVFLSGAEASRFAWASSMKRWSSRAAPATPLSWARRPGASMKSRTTGCWYRRRRASRAKCRFGMETTPAARSSLAAALAAGARTARYAAQRSAEPPYSRARS